MSDVAEFEARADTSDVSAGGFPRVDDLCEHCGYRLIGLDPSAACPECGATVGESDPRRRRPGLPWQRAISPLSWWWTLWQSVFRPRRSYTRLSLGGSNAADRCYLASMAGLVGGLWWAVFAMAEVSLPWLWGLGAAGAVVGLTYLEALGIGHFCRAKGWRMPWRRAERVVCYAAAGWLPAGLVGAKVAMLAVHGQLDTLWPAAWPPLSLLQQMWLVVVVSAVASMPFELLVFLGSRRVRFGNDHRPDTSHADPVEPASVEAHA